MGWPPVQCDWHPDNKGKQRQTPHRENLCENWRDAAPSQTPTSSQGSLDRPCLCFRGRTSTAHTSTSAFQPLGLWEKTFLWVKPLHLWFFAPGVPGH